MEIVVDRLLFNPEAVAAVASAGDAGDSRLRLIEKDAGGRVVMAGSIRSAAVSDASGWAATGWGATSHRRTDCRRGQSAG